MSEAELTIRLQALDGVWEVGGADRGRGIVPESVQLVSNEWGSDTCRFILRRDPGAIFPDLGAFTPFEVEVAGVVVWSGFCWETPSQEGDDAQMGVEGRGWQYHLDDDVYQRAYVHSKLTEWVDVRSRPDTNLANYKVSGQVEVGSGVINIGWPKDTSLTGPDDVGVVLQLPEPNIKRVVIPYETSANSTSIFLQVIGYEYVGATGQALYNTALTTAGASGTIRVTANPACRYLYVLLAYGGATTTISAQVYARLKAARIFAATAYESGDVSVFKSSDAITDALGFAPLLDQDVSLIDASTFSHPDFTLSEDRTPREVIEAANAAHRWVTKVRADRKLRFTPQPTVPMFRAGQWDGVEFKDASRNAGQELYNRAVVRGTGPDGDPVKAERYAAAQAGAITEAISSPAPVNPSFAADLSGWTLWSNYGGGAFTRDTVLFDSSPASGKASASMELHADFTGSAFRKGVPYTLTMRVRMNAGSKGYGQISLYLGVLEANPSPYDWGVRRSLPAPGVWVTQSVTWIPKADRAASTVQLSINMIDGGNVDSLELSAARPTLIDRKGFLRSKVISMSPAINDSVGQQFGDVFLADHKRAPLKGELVALPRAMRLYLGDAPVHPAHILMHTTELVHLSHLVDPDTGNLGRDAPIANVSYDHDAQKASVALDATRDRFETLVQRYSVIVG